MVFGELLSKGQSSDQDGNCDSGINLNLPCDELLNADGLQRQINEGMYEVTIVRMPPRHINIVLNSFLTYQVVGKITTSHRFL